MQDYKKKRSGGYSIRKEVIAKAREKQKANLLKLIKNEGDEKDFLHLKDILIDGKTIREAASKNSYSRSAISRQLRKLEYSADNPLIDSRIEKILSPKIKNKLKKVLSEQPFKLRPTKTTDEHGKKFREYYTYYKWTNGIVKRYISERWGEDVGIRTCTNLLNELSPPKKAITDKYTSEEIKNTWLFLNFKVCEITSTIETGQNDLIKYYACIAHSWASNDTFFTIHPKRSQYTRFIKSILADDMSDEAIVFFAENNSKKTTKDNNAFAFCKHRKKIKMIIHSTVPFGEFYKVCESIEITGEGGDKSCNTEVAFSWLKDKLLHSGKDLADIDKCSAEGNELEDMLDIFLDELLITIYTIRKYIQKKFTGEPMDTVTEKIKKQFIHYSMREKN